jgi:hypothetical protein
MNKIHYTVESTAKQITCRDYITGETLSLFEAAKKNWNVARCSDGQVFYSKQEIKF